MANVLTEASIIQCVHQGKIAVTASQTALTVDGQKVLVQSDMLSAVVTCPAVTNPNTGIKQCTSVTNVSGGVASKVTLGGQPVLLDSAQGFTDGLTGGNPATWSVTSAGQTKLQAS